MQRLGFGRQERNVFFARQAGRVSGSHRLQLLLRLAQQVQVERSNRIDQSAVIVPNKQFVGEHGPRRQPIDFLEAIAPRDEAPEQTPGAIVRGLLDTGHWLASGTDGEIGVLVEGTRIFSPITLDRGTNVGRYAEAADLVMGGNVWEDAKPQLASKPFLVHQPIGSGQLIAFAEDPNYRAYAEATQLLFINAVLLGPGR